MRFLLFLILAPFAFLMLVPLGALMIGVGAGIFGVVVGIIGAIFGLIVAAFAAVFGGIFAFGFIKALLILFVLVVVGLLISKRPITK